MRDPSNVKKISICAMVAALCVAVMALGSLIDVLDASLSLIAGVLVLIVDLEFTGAYSWSVFLVAAPLSFLLPLKSPAILFAGFFGWYPLVRKALDRLAKPLKWLVKLVFFNLLFALYLSLSILFFGVEEGPGWLLAVTAVLGELFFILYDLALNRFIFLYFMRFRHRLGFGKNKK